YSSFPARMGRQNDGMDYVHETGHVVRYVHGSCSQTFPATQLFSLFEQTLGQQFGCVTEACGFLGAMSEEKEFQIEPHFRGQLFESGIHKPEIEMGFFFDARYASRTPVGDGGNTVTMNPGYSVGATADGFVSVAMINADQNGSNVIVDGLKED